MATVISRSSGSGSKKALTTAAAEEQDALHSAPMGSNLCPNCGLLPYHMVLTLVEDRDGPRATASTTSHGDHVNGTATEQCLDLTLSRSDFRVTEIIRAQNQCSPNHMTKP